MSFRSGIKMLNQKGMALTIVMITLLLLSIIAGYALNLSYNERKLLAESSGRRIKIYYAAQAGVIDALWRIRTKYTGATDYTLAAPGGNLSDPNYSATYNMDIDRDGVNDVTVTIGRLDTGPVNLTYLLRPITSRGLDHYSAATNSISVTTFYPTPDGFYRDLDVVSTTDLARTGGKDVIAGGTDNVGNLLGLGITSGAYFGGYVSVGTTAPSALKAPPIRIPFEVRGRANSRYTASFLSPTGYGVGVGNFSNNAFYGAVQGRAPLATGTWWAPLGLNAATPLAPGVLNSVHVGSGGCDNAGVCDRNYDLLVVGNTGKIGITDHANGDATGEVKVAQAADRNYYAVFA